MYRYVFFRSESGLIFGREHDIGGRNSRRCGHYIFFHADKTGNLFLFIFDIFLNGIDIYCTYFGLKARFVGHFDEGVVTKKGMGLSHRRRDWWINACCFPPENQTALAPNENVAVRNALKDRA
jgi:hypothetical protein